ncbi:MAG: glycosyltransferase 87 family protein [Dehalococcoidia bacterium]|jgi:hypothetical protein
MSAGAKTAAIAARGVRLFRRALRADRERVLALTFVAIAVLFNAWYLWPEVGINVPKLNDGVLHVLSLQRMVTSLRSGQDPTDSWLPNVTTGYPLFHYYQHLPFLPPAVFAAIFRGVGITTVYNWTSYLLLCAFPLSIYWSMRRFGFSRITGGLAAMVAPLIATNGLYGLDFSSYVWRGYGLYTQLWGMVLLPPALAQSYTTLRTGRGYLWSVVLVAAELLSHLVLGYIAVVSLGAFVLLRPTWRAAWLRGRRLALLLGLVAIVTSYMIVPFVLDGAYFNRSVWELPTKYDAFGYPWTLRTLFGGQLFDYGRFRSLTLLVGAGALLCAWRWRDEKYRIPAVIGGLWLALYFGRPTWGVLLNLLPFSRDLQLHRLIAGVHLGGIMLMGIALAVPWRWSLARRSAKYLLLPAGITALVLFPVYRERIDFLQGNQSMMQTQDVAYRLAQPDLDALESKLRSLPPGRVYAGLAANWGKDYRVDDVPMSAILNAAGFDMIGYLYHSLSLNADIQVLFDEQRPEQYDLFNIRYVVAPKTRTFPDFVKPIGDFGDNRLYQVSTSGYFELVGSDVTFQGDKETFYPAVSKWLASGLPGIGEHPTILFQGSADAGVYPLPLSTAPDVLANMPFGAAPGRGEISSEQVEDNSYAATVNVQTPSMLMLKETYVPGWHAYIDGQKVKTYMLMPSYVGVKVTPGRHFVTFEYRSETYRRLLLLLGLLTLPAIGAAELIGRRRRAASSSALETTDSGPPADAMLVETLDAEALPRTGGAASRPGGVEGLTAAASYLAAGVAIIRRAFASTAARIVAIIVVALLIRLPLLPLYAYLPGNSLDEYAWKRWMETIHQYGVLNVFRHANTDYVGYHWVLWLLSAVYGWMGSDYAERAVRPGQYSALVTPLHLLLKVPPLAFDAALIVAVFAATAALLARRVRRARAQRMGLIAAAVIAVHPAVVYESAVWAQIDAAIAAAMIASVVLAARGRPGWAAACWAVGFAIKPQPIVVVPVLVVLVLRRSGWRGLVKSAAVATGVFAIIISPWVLHGDASRIYDIYNTVFRSQQYSDRLSADAWNLWWFWDVGSHPLPHDAIFSGLAFITFKSASFALSLAAAVVAAAYTWRRPTLSGALIAAAYMAFAFYLLPTGTHERYLYPFLGLLLPVALLGRRWLPLYAAVSATFTANLLVVAPPIHDWMGRWVSSPFSLGVAAANVALFSAMTLALIYGALPWRWRSALAVRFKRQASLPARP